MVLLPWQHQLTITAYFLLEELCRWIPALETILLLPKYALSEEGGPD